MDTLYKEGFNFVLNRRETEKAGAERVVIEVFMEGMEVIEITDKQYNWVFTHTGIIVQCSIRNTKFSAVIKPA